MLPMTDRRMTLRPLPAEDYQILVEKAQTLEADGHGPKVLRLRDGSFLKLFRRKRWLSSALLRPYALRFAENAARLMALDIPAPEVIGTYQIDSIARSAVHYRPLPGITLRQALEGAGADEQEALVRRMGNLLARLHRAGVYFRSLHLGNVLLLPDDSLGLIDIADLSWQGSALSIIKRKRNLKHISRYPQDRQWLFNQHRLALLEGYRQVAPGEEDFLEHPLRIA